MCERRSVQILTLLNIGLVYFSTPVHETSTYETLKVQFAHEFKIPNPCEYKFVGNWWMEVPYVIGLIFPAKCTESIFTFCYIFWAYGFMRFTKRSSK